MGESTVIGLSSVTSGVFGCTLFISINLPIKCFLNAYSSLMNLIIFASTNYLLYSKIGLSNAWIITSEIKSIEIALSLVKEVRERFQFVKHVY